MSVTPQRSTFNLGREPPFPSLYPENKTPVTVDVLEVGWIVAFLTIYFCYLMILPALGGKEKILYFLRVTLTLFLGLVVVLCLFGQEWEVGEVQSLMLYKAGSSEEIDGQVGVRLGLSAVNITLKALNPPAGDLRGEIINYNERFYLTNGMGQGRFGFGPFAAEISQEFREAQRRGAPYPILWIAEYFTFDGEGLRFGRNYRLAGFYCRICLWMCIPVWMLTVILFKMVIRYGALMLTFLGTLLLLSALIWAGSRNFLELAIIFSDEHILKTYYGYQWYLALIVGIFCIITGIAIYFLNSILHNELSKLFGVDPFNILDEVYGDEEDELKADDKHTTDVEMAQMSKPPIRRKRPTVRLTVRGTKSHQHGSVQKNFVTELTPPQYSSQYADGANQDAAPNLSSMGYDEYLRNSYANYGYDSAAEGYPQSQMAYYPETHPAQGEGEAYLQPLQHEQEGVDQQAFNQDQSYGQGYPNNFSHQDTQPQQYDAQGFPVASGEIMDEVELYGDVKPATMQARQRHNY